MTYTKPNDSALQTSDITDVNNIPDEVAEFLIEQHSSSAGVCTGGATIEDIFKDLLQHDGAHIVPSEYNDVASGCLESCNEHDHQHHQTFHDASTETSSRVRHTDENHLQTLDLTASENLHFRLNSSVDAGQSKEQEDHYSDSCNIVVKQEHLDSGYLCDRGATAMPDTCMTRYPPRQTTCNGIPQHGRDPNSNYRSHSDSTSTANLLHQDCLREVNGYSSTSVWFNNQDVKQCAIKSDSSGINVVTRPNIRSTTATATTSHQYPHNKLKHKRNDSFKQLKPSTARHDKNKRNSKKEQSSSKNTEKYERRKKQNRDAATRCRMKKQANQKQTEADYHNLCAENVSLERQIEELSQELYALNVTFASHKCVMTTHVSSVDTPAASA